LLHLVGYLLYHQNQCTYEKLYGYGQTKETDGRFAWALLTGHIQADSQFNPGNISDSSIIRFAFYFTLSPFFSAALVIKFQGGNDVRVSGVAHFDVPQNPSFYLRK
jgi:hypothetical protein